MLFSETLSLVHAFSLSTTFKMECCWPLSYQWAECWMERRNHCVLHTFISSRFYGLFSFVLFPSHKTLKIYMLFITTTTLSGKLLPTQLWTVFYLCHLYISVSMLCLVYLLYCSTSGIQKLGEKLCMKRPLYSYPVFRKTFVTHHLVTATHKMRILFYYNKRSCNISIKKKNLVCLAGRMFRGKSWKKRNTLKGFEHSKVSSRVYQGQMASVGIICYNPC